MGRTSRGGPAPASAAREAGRDSGAQRLPRGPCNANRPRTSRPRFDSAWKTECPLIARSPSTTSRSSRAPTSLSGSRARTGSPDRGLPRPGDRERLLRQAQSWLIRATLPSVATAFSKRETAETRAISSTPSSIRTGVGSPPNHSASSGRRRRSIPSCGCSRHPTLTCGRRPQRLSAGSVPPRRFLAFEDVAVNDEEPFVRSWAIGALGQLGGSGRRRAGAPRCCSIALCESVLQPP